MTYQLMARCPECGTIDYPWAERDPVCGNCGTDAAPKKVSAKFVHDYGNLWQRMFVPDRGHWEVSRSLGEPGCAYCGREPCTCGANA